MLPEIKIYHKTLLDCNPNDQGNAHIAYQGTSYDLNYATNSGGAWTNELIYQGGAGPENQSIAWWENSLFVSSYVYNDLSLNISTKDLSQKERFIRDLSG